MGEPYWSLISQLWESSQAFITGSASSQLRPETSLNVSPHDASCGVAAVVRVDVPGAAAVEVDDGEAPPVLLVVVRAPVLVAVVGTGDPVVAELVVEAGVESCPAGPVLVTPPVVLVPVEPVPAPPVAVVSVTTLVLEPQPASTSASTRRERPEHTARRSSRGAMGWWWGEIGTPAMVEATPGRTPVAAPPLRSSGVITTNQFKNGNHIDVDGTIFKILEFQHVKPGKGGAFVRTKLRRSSDGAVIDRTFRAGEKFRPVRTEVRNMQYLYRDGTDAHFMDAESYEQLTIPEPAIAAALQWMRESDTVELLYIDDQPNDVQLPSAIDLEVTETEPGLRGDTASGGGTKPATVETGARVMVPLFVDIGDRVRVDTRTGEYMSRA